MLHSVLLNGGYILYRQHQLQLEYIIFHAELAQPAVPRCNCLHAPAAKAMAFAVGNRNTILQQNPAVVGILDLNEQFFQPYRTI